MAQGTSNPPTENNDRSLKHANSDTHLVDLPQQQQQSDRFGATRQNQARTSNRHREALKRNSRGEMVLVEVIPMSSDATENG